MKQGAKYGGVAIACAAALLAGCSGGHEGKPGGEGQGGQEQQAPMQPPPPPQHEGQGGDEGHLDAAAKQQMQGKMEEMLQQRPITFEPDSAELTDQGKQTVSELAKMMSNAPGEMRLEIGGYTAPGPPSGAEGNAEQLSQERAQKVIDMMTQEGVATERMEAKAHGDAPDGDPEAARRVDVKIL